MIAVLVCYKKSGDHIEHKMFEDMKEAIDYAISVTLKARYTFVYSVETGEVYNLLVGGMYTPKVYRLTDMAKVDRILEK